MKHCQAGRTAAAVLAALVVGGAAIVALGGGDPGSDPPESAGAPLPPEDGTSGMALASPFSHGSAAAGRAGHRRPGKEAAGQAGQQPDPASAPGEVPEDRSQALHIAESRWNYNRFLQQPDGYTKYEYLAGVQYDHVPGLEEEVYNRFLSHHARLGFDELVQDIGSNPHDHAANADRYRRMLEIIAKVPCPVDDNWEGCIAQTLGRSRAEVEGYHARAKDLVDEQNLARLRSVEASADPQQDDAIQHLYDSVAPLLARALDGDEQTLRRFGLTATEAERLIRRMSGPGEDGEAP